MRIYDPEELVEVTILDEKEVVGKLIIKRKYRDKILQKPYGIHFTINKKTKKCEMYDRTEREDRFDTFLYENFSEEKSERW